MLGDMAANYTQQVIDSLLAQEEAMIRAAINHVIGNINWNVADIAHRGNMECQASGKRTFVFDGIPLIEFFPVTGGINHNGIESFFTASAHYRRLYDIE